MQGHSHRENRGEKLEHALRLHTPRTALDESVVTRYTWLGRLASPSLDTPSFA